MWMYLIVPNCTPKNGKGDTFSYVYFTIIKTLKKYTRHSSRKPQFSSGKRATAETEKENISRGFTSLMKLLKRLVSVQTVQVSAVEHECPKPLVTDARYVDVEDTAFESSGFGARSWARPLVMGSRQMA